MDDLIENNKSWAYHGVDPYSMSTSHYMLISQDSAHTTWHQDFSATSVFYTVLKGEKVFFLVKPTENNLEVFKKWPKAETDKM